MRIDCNDGKMRVVSTKPTHLIDAEQWLKGSSDRFIGDHDWDSCENEEMNDDSLRWIRGLKEAGAIEIMVDNFHKVIFLLNL